MAKMVPQRIQQHQVWHELNTLGQTLAAAEPLLEGAEPEALSLHASLVALVDHTREVLKSINPVIVPEDQLDPVTSSISAITAAVNLAIEQGDTAQLAQAWGRAAALLSTLAVLPLVKSRHDMKGVAAAVDQFHQHLGELLDDVQEHVDTLSDEIEGLNERRTEIATDISAQKDALATAITGFEDQIVTAISEFQGQIAAEQTQQAAEYTAAFDAAQAKLDAANKQGKDFYEQDEARHDRPVPRVGSQPPGAPSPRASRSGRSTQLARGSPFPVATLHPSDQVASGLVFGVASSRRFNATIIRDVMLRPTLQSS